MLRGKGPHVKAQARYLPSCETGASYPAYDRRISSRQGGGPHGTSVYSPDLVLAS
jgi:hypothetical protein